MSRSNPNESAHPCTKWFEWSGKTGNLKYYDGEENIEVESKNFIFLVLDELATVKGYDEPNECGIYANEVRNTTTDPMAVKSRKGGPIATGLYQEIKDTVKARGGRFVCNIYMAYKNDDGELVIGSLQVKGAALNARVDFKKANKKLIHEQAVRIIGTKKGKKGSVEFVSPVFEMYEVTEKTNEAAKGLDEELQQYLTTYLAPRVVTQEGERFVPDSDYTEEETEEPPDEPTTVAEEEEGTNDLPF